MRAGWSVVGESWGARLRLDPEAAGQPSPDDAAALLAEANDVAPPPRSPDLSTPKSLVHRATATGATIAELGPEWSAALAALEAITAPDYPVTPATPHEAITAEQAAALFATGHRVFGAAVEGELVAATVMEPSPAGRPSYAETAFTSVLPAFRGRGLGAAVKAASVIALAHDGVRTFGTGGAGLNAASLGANRAVGYVVTERWRSYASPGPA